MICAACSMGQGRLALTGRIVGLNLWEPTCQRLPWKPPGWTCSAATPSPGRLHGPSMTSVTVVCITRCLTDDREVPQRKAWTWHDLRGGLPAPTLSRGPGMTASESLWMGELLLPADAGNRHQWIENCLQVTHRDLPLGARLEVKPLRISSKTDPHSHLNWNPYCTLNILAGGQGCHHQPFQYWWHFSSDPFKCQWANRDLDPVL